MNSKKKKNLLSHFRRNKDEKKNWKAKEAGRHLGISFCDDDQA